MWLVGKLQYYYMYNICTSILRETYVPVTCHNMLRMPLIKVDLYKNEFAQCLLQCHCVHRHAVVIKPTRMFTG